MLNYISYASWHSLNIVKITLFLNVHPKYVHFKRFPGLGHKPTIVTINTTEFDMFRFNMVRNVAPVIPLVVTGDAGPHPRRTSDHLTQDNTVQLYNIKMSYTKVLKSFP